MTVEWLEEQFAKRIEENDRLSAEVEELKDVIHGLLPLDRKTEKCEFCAWSDYPPKKKWHQLGEFSERCLEHGRFDKARKMLGL